MHTLVALDIETTGLDPERDAIIEIGAVKFRVEGERAEETEAWQSLVNPGRSLPPFVVELTGIRQEEVDRAPLLTDVLAPLSRFVGDCPIVGHNVAFDLAFFSRYRLFRENLPLDTIELASVLFPNAGRYTLSALVQELGLGTFDAHRGLDDARAAFRLYLALRERALALDPAVLGEIVADGERVAWTATPMLSDALAIVLARAGLEAPPPPRELTALLREGPPAVPPLRPAPETAPLDAEEMAALLAPPSGDFAGGAVAQRLEHYEHRPQQIAMLRALCAAFNAPNHLLVEAGTGTGKSLAYLIPALRWSVRNGRRVVISTNTINLQDQLINKDLPDLQAALPEGFRASVLKGRANYLCPRRLEALRHTGPANPEEMRLLAKLLVWLPTTQTGDRAELTLLGAGEQFAWSRLSAEVEGCSPERCAMILAGVCPFWRARAQAESAHVIVVNHALLLADVVTGSRVLPEYQYLIVDEAHHLEDATTRGLSFHADRAALDRALAELAGGGGRSGSAGRPGLLSDVLTAVHGHVPREMASELQVWSGRLAAGIAALQRHLTAFFEAYASFLAEQVEPQGYDGGLRVLLDHSMRVQPGWSQLETAWEIVSVQFGAILDGLKGLSDRLSDLEYFEIEGWEELVARVLGAQRELHELRVQLNQVVTQPSPSVIYWAEADGRLRNPSLHAAPLHVGPLVEQHLFRSKASVVLTSATLRVEDDFAFLRDRLHAWEADELAVDSPFDYQRSTLLYLVNDIPEPNQAGYQTSFERGLLQLCLAARGRTLVLFTSYSQMRTTSQAISTPLGEAGIVVYEQTDGSSRRQLLDSFREAERAVLLGTRSFWEGVDVPGEALSVLVMPRLPFTVPSDPIFVARSRTFDNPFEDYAVPEAVLRFRQGFGRLIRRESDRGVVAVFDKRILSKAYGRRFIDALPVCTVRRGAVAQLPIAAQQWLDGI